MGNSDSTRGVDVGDLGCNGDSLEERVLAINEDPGTISHDGFERTTKAIMILMKSELRAIMTQRFPRDLWENKNEPGSMAE
jgi:hypothetical protein